MSVPEVLPLSPPATSSGSRKRPLPLFASKPTTSTPDDSPASGPESSSLGSKKKVEFSPWADIHQPAALPTSSLDAPSIKSLPPSRECHSYIKSILKSSIPDDRQMLGYDGPADEKLPLNEIMESIVHQLSRNDNTESIDAYQTLASTIKAYGEIPDQAVLKNKLNSITRHIRQHLGVRDKQDPQPSDANLATSALKVLVILVWSTDFAPLLTDDFRSFILDRAISVIAEHKAPKSVIVHYLHLLATQDFRPSLLISNSRAPRLVEALKGLTEHVKGNGTVSERLLVYQRLLDQARQVMKSKSTCWVEHMLAGMASNIADTRSKALALGRKACQAFPASSSISGSVRLALDLKQESGRTLGTSVCRRLEKMVIVKDDAAQVPQIWAVILLLCNNVSMRIDAWQSMKEWLMVIQRCFNGSDAMLRAQANAAWNRFVYIARPHEASDSLVTMLSKPVAAQLERTANDKSSKVSHAVAIASYCNLLYYAFRPASSSYQYTRAWNEYIVKVMRSSFFEKSSANADIASRILMALFWDTKTCTKVWNENRAHENRLVEPEELPTIDCKWIRSRCSPILEIFQVVFRYSSWGFPASSDQAYVSKAWRHFLRAIREAGSKEIKMSNETRSGIANILEFLTKVSSPEESQLSLKTDDSIHLPKEILTTISHTAVAELSVGRVLDVMEAEPVPYSPWLFTVIFEMMKVDLRSSGKSGASMAKLFSIISTSLERQYENKDRMHPAKLSSVIDVVSQILCSMPSTLVETGLQTLGSGLSLWIRDEDSFLSPEKDPELGRSLRVPLTRFVDAFTAALDMISPRSVAKLDTCLAAAFASSHSTVVSAVAQVWNQKLGNSEDVDIGPQLADAINRLLPYVELRLPSTWTDAEGEQLPPSLPAYQTQYESAPQGTPNRKTKSPMPKETKEAPAQEAQPNDDDGLPNDLPEAGLQDAPCTSSKHRHDDSQLQFVTIESSPPRSVLEESQFLTDRQKEVRHRQRVEPAVVFPDLRSSPRPHSRHSEPRDCGFARKAATMVERPATPTLPEHADAMEAEPQPSPTPKSRVLREVAEVDVPSSPPSMQGFRSEVDVQNVSSPIPDTGEPEDRQVELGSPLNPPITRQAVENTGIVEQEVNAHDADGGGGSEVPESVEHYADRAQVSTEDDVVQPKHVEKVTTVIKTSPEPTSEQMVSAAQEAEILLSPPIVPVHGIITPPQPSSSVLNTDELNELSASQLSHDLDWATVLEGLDTPATVSKSPRPVFELFARINEAVVPDQEEEELPQDDETEHNLDHREPTLPKPSQKKRKRPQSGYAERKKRRKTSRSLSRSSSSQGSQFKREEEEELFDCIVVDTSSDYLGSSSPAHPMGEEPDGYVMFQPMQDDEQSRSLQLVGGLKRRERSRKTTQSKIKHERTDDLEELRNIPEEGSQSQLPKRRTSSRRSRSRHRLSLSASAEPQLESPESRPRSRSRTQQRLVPVVQVTAPTSDAAPEPPGSIGQLVPDQWSAFPVDDENHPPPDTSQRDVVANLQAVLEQIKTAGPGSVDLRAVDELCFQIRFQAQVIATGDGRAP